jgi:hypothetical protein
MNAPLQKQLKPDGSKIRALSGGQSQSGQLYSSSTDLQQAAGLQGKAGNYANQSRIDAASQAGVKETRRGPRSSEEIVALNATIGGVYIAAARIDIADGLLKAYSRNIASRLAAVEAFSNFQRQLQEEFPVTSWLVTRFTSDLPESKSAPANLAQADISIRKAEYRAAVDFLAMAENEVDQLVKATSGYQESQEIATSRFISGLQGVKVAGGIAVGVLTAGSGTAVVAVAGAGYTAAQEASEQAMKVHLGLMQEIDWEGIVVDAIINLAIGKLLAGLNRFSRGKEFAQSFRKVAPWELRKIPEQEIKQFAIATGKYLLSKQTVKEMLHAKLAAFLQITLKSGYDALRGRDQGKGFPESIKQKFAGMLFDEKGDVDFQGIFFQALSDAMGSATNRAAVSPLSSSSDSVSKETSSQDGNEKHTTNDQASKIAEPKTLVSEGQNSNSTNQSVVSKPNSTFTSSFSRKPSSWIKPRKNGGKIISDSASLGRGTEKPTSARKANGHSPDIEATMIAEYGLSKLKPPLKEMSSAWVAEAPGGSTRPAIPKPEVSMTGLAEGNSKKSGSRVVEIPLSELSVDIGPDQLKNQQEFANSTKEFTAEDLEFAGQRDPGTDRVGPVEVEFTKEQLAENSKKGLGPNALGGFSPADSLGRKVEWDHSLGVAKAVEYDIPNQVGNVDALGVNTRTEFNKKFTKGQSSFTHDDFSGSKGERGHILGQENSKADISPDLGLPGLDSKFAANQQREIAKNLMQMDNVWWMDGEGSTGINQGPFRDLEVMMHGLKADNPRLLLRARIEATFSNPPRMVTSPSGANIPGPEAFVATVTSIPTGNTGQPQVVRQVVLQNKVGSTPVIIIDNPVPTSG